MGGRYDEAERIRELTLYVRAEIYPQVREQWLAANGDEVFRRTFVSLDLTEAQATRVAQPGSLDVLLDAYGGLAAILLSDPVQLVLTLQVLLGLPRRVIRWIRRGHEVVVADVTDESLLRLSGRIAQGRIPRGTNMSVVRETAAGDRLSISIRRD
jgi:hypothetical protein